MRIRSILLLACLLTTGLAALPGAAADPSPECADQDFVDGNARVTLRGDCSLEVALLEDTTCVGGWGGTIEQDVGDDTAIVHYCDGGLGQRIGDLLSLSLARPCNEAEAGFWGAGVYTHSDCSADLYAVDAYRLCPDGTDDQYLGLAAAGSSLTAGYCTPSLAVSAAPCTDDTFSYGSATVYTSQDCHTRVDIKSYDCVWNCDWKTLVDTPVLTVRLYGDNGYPTQSTLACGPKEMDVPAYGTTVSLRSDCDVHVDVAPDACIFTQTVTLLSGPIDVTARICDGPTPPPTMAAAPACDGFWYAEREVGPATVYTDGSLDCTGASLDTEASAGKDIYVPNTMACFWGGGYRPVASTPVATVWVFTCSPPTE